MTRQHLPAGVLRHTSADVGNGKRGTDAPRIIDPRGEPVKPRFQSKTTMLDNVYPFDFPAGQLEAELVSILQNRYGVHLFQIPKDFEPHRILDLGAGVGSFGVWAWKQWPGAWYDAIELDSRLHTMLAGNLPPGGKILGIRDELRLPYDVVRVTDTDLATRFHDACTSARYCIVDVLQVKS